MTYNYYQKHKEDSEKKPAKDINIFLKKKNIKGKKRLEEDIKILLKKKKKKGVIKTFLRSTGKS